MILGRYFILFLFLVVLISYGQTLGMYVWQDDNGLFFKLAHLAQRAGYLDAGPFGVGAYKYIQTPYIPIYYLFGFNTVAYFTFTLILYFLATVTIYKVFSNIFEKKVGMVVSSLFAAGYIASDGFIRLFNSAITSVSIILISLMFLSHWRFLHNRSLGWYIASLTFFFLNLELARARSHYLIAVVVLFELLFLAFRRPVINFIYSGLRILPFVGIFYYYFILNADYRSGQVKNLLLSLARGEIYQLYSFLTSFLNVVIPDWVMQQLLTSRLNLNLFSWIFVILAVAYVIFLLRFYAQRKILIPVFCCTILAWKFSVKSLFSTPVLNLSEQQIFTVLLGGLLVILTLVTLVAINRNYKKIYVFLVGWVVLNIAAYAAYNPTVAYESVNRYLAHSFWAWIGVLGIFYASVQHNPKLQKLVLVVLLLLGTGNLFASVLYQRNILQNRSNPPREFYNVLKGYVPIVNIGDIFYFDVGQDSKGYFNDAFSVASMPETTAIAWRYGVDRYDFKLVTEFTDLVKEIRSQGASAKQIHSFWYTNKQLVNTSDLVTSILFKPQVESEVDFSIDSEQGISFRNPVSSVTPFELIFDVQALAESSSSLEFPYYGSQFKIQNLTTRDSRRKLLAINYAKAKEQILEKAIFKSSSDWRERILSNISDRNPDTVWQADRVLWQKRNEGFTIDVGSLKEVNRLVWINGFGGNTPTHYSVEVSSNGNDWKLVKEEDSIKRVDTKDPQVIEFSPQFARYFKMTITRTIGGDSPAIAESWVVPVEFKDLNIKEAEEFIKQPFSYVESKQEYQNLLAALNNQGFAQLYWYGDKANSWITQPTKRIELIFDGVIRPVKIVVPAGGTVISKVKLDNLSIPGKIVVDKIKVRHLGLNETKI